MGTKIWFFFKKFEIEFDLCWRAEINIQVGLTYMSTSGMHRRPFEGRHLVVFIWSFSTCLYYCIYLKFLYLSILLYLFEVSLPVYIIVFICSFFTCLYYCIFLNFFTCLYYCIYCASPSSGKAYRDKQLINNFELWVEIFLCADMFPCVDSKTVSVCPSVSTPRKEITIVSSISVLH